MSSAGSGPGGASVKQTDRAKELLTATHAASSVFG